jgi:hypothetical protein
MDRLPTVCLQRKGIRGQIFLHVQGSLTFFNGNSISDSGVVIPAALKMLIACDISVKQTKRVMRLKIKQHLGPEQPEGTRGRWS